MTPQRVTLITLGVDDLERSKAFYGQLGWVPAQAQEGVAFYQMQGWVAFSTAPRWPRIRGGQGPRWVPGR